MFSLLTLFQPNSAFWHTAVCTMYVKWTYLCPTLCPIHFADSARCQFMVAHIGFPTDYWLQCIFCSDWIAYKSTSPIALHLQ